MPELLGNEHLREQFSSLVDRNRLHHCLLFEGPSGIGKFQCAVWLAKRLFCEENTVCGRCWHCQSIDTKDHPDVLFVGLDPTKRRLQISVDQARDLIQKVAVYPRTKNCRVVIIDQANYMNEDTANALLKTFEEPPTRTIFVLITPSSRSLLPTIRSRAQRILFRPVSEQRIAEWLSRQGEQASEHLIRLSEGCPGRLFQLMEGEYEKTIESREIVLRLLRGSYTQMYAETEQIFKSFPSSAEGAQQKIAFSQRFLGTLEILLRDVLVWQSTALVDKLIHFDCLDEIDRWAQVLDERCVRDLHKQIDQARLDQEINVNGRLQMEQILVQLRFALRNGYVAG